jgi:hypothetical protein
VVHDNITSTLRENVRARELTLTSYPSCKYRMEPQIIKERTMSVKIDYRVMLDNLNSRLGELDGEREKVLSAIRAISPLAGVVIEEDKPLPGILFETEPIKISKNEFSNDTINSAVQRYLKMAGGPQTVINICDALIKGGFPTNSSRFYSTVYSAISRKTDIFEKIENTWGLHNWD